MLSGQPLALFIFGSSTENVRTETFDFYGDGTKWSLYLLLRALSFETLHLLYAYTKRASFTEEHLGKRITHF